LLLSTLIGGAFPSLVGPGDGQSFAGRRHVVGARDPAATK
jgi:hypothetical protein